MTDVAVISLLMPRQQRRDALTVPLHLIEYILSQVCFRIQDGRFVNDVTVIVISDICLSQMEIMN